MRAADPVFYVDGAGAVAPATVCGIPGTGASSYKTLDVRLADGTVVSQVAHERDRVAGGAFWTLTAPPPPVVVPVAEDEPRGPRRSRRDF